jgi:thioredoxin 2
VARTATRRQNLRIAASDVVTCPHCGRKNRVPAAATGMPRCGHCHQPLPWIADATDTTYAAVVEEARPAVIVDLWAPWCGPCRMVSPALENLARQYAGKVKLVKVNVDESPAISRRFSVQGIPTLLLVRNGEVVARQTGAAPEPALRSWLDKGLASA